MKKYTFSDFKNTILFYVFIYVLIDGLFQWILYLNGFVFLRWMQSFSKILIAAGLLLGTLQLYFRHRGHRFIFILFFVIETIFMMAAVSTIILSANTESITVKDGRKMVKETHSFLLSNWIKYYDYENLFYRSRQERIYEAYDDSLEEYMYTIYYDKSGRVERRE